MNFIKKGDIYASIDEDKKIKKITPIINIEYLIKSCPKGSDFVNCIRIIRSEKEMEAVPIIRKTGINIKFCGSIDTSDKKKPLKLIWLTRNPTVNPITIPFKNKRIKIMGKPMTEIPNIQIKPIYFT